MLATRWSAYTCNFGRNPYSIARPNAIFPRRFRLHGAEDEAPAMTRERAEQDQRLTWAFQSGRRRLLAFIRGRIPPEIDAEDILQDVFFELVEAFRLMKPIAHAGAWMMQVARNRITDLFRRGKKEVVEDGGRRILEDLLPSPDAGPDALYARGVLLVEIELPPSQRHVFFAHEIDGRSFAEISEETGVSVNTLLSRKHYAVKRLRNRLQHIYDELGYERRNK
jgi:RNA polymerase sigma factor (sigma-70 family)